MQKACQSCCLNELNNLQDSSFKINKELPTNYISQSMCANFCSFVIYIYFFILIYAGL